LWSPQDIERNGHRVLTNCSAIETVFARTGGECSGERDAVLFPVAILNLGTNFSPRLASDGHNAAAIGKAADGFLETISGDLLHRVKDESVN
jgi:hypothetical protein